MPCTGLAAMPWGSLLPGQKHSAVGLGSSRESSKRLTQCSVVELLPVRSRRACRPSASFTARNSSSPLPPTPRSSSGRGRPANPFPPRSSGDDGSGASLDVSGACVEPVFRTIPRPKAAGDRAQGEVRVLFVSEGNVCRSVIAEAVLRSLVRSHGLDGAIACESKAVRDYNLDEPPEPLAVAVASQCGVALDESHRARLFQPAQDIVDFDLLVVMDKFNAADVLKEVSVFDTIDPKARFSSKVRRLGDFCKRRVVEDIDDPLYGNMGGPDELEKLSDAVTDIQESCEGLLEELQHIHTTSQGRGGFRNAVGSWLKGMEDIDWLVPPMLQKRVAP